MGIVIAVIIVAMVLVAAAIALQRRRRATTKAPAAEPAPPIPAPVPMLGLETALDQATDRSGRNMRQRLEGSAIDDLRVPDDTGPVLRRALDHVEHTGHESTASATGTSDTTSSPDLDQPPTVDQLPPPA